MSDAAVEDWISLREFSRRRGVSLTAVQRAIADGRVKAVRRNEASGNLEAIEYHAGSREWNENTDLTQAARTTAAILSPAASGKNSPATTSGALPAGPSVTAQGSSALIEGRMAAGDGAKVPPVAGSIGDLPFDQPAARANEGLAAAEKESYLGYRTRTEEFRAKQAELDYLVALGRLISRSAAREVAFRRYRAIRDKLENIADRLAPELAAERDPARVHAMLLGEIKQVLNELSADARTESAGGPVESVVV